MSKNLFKGFPSLKFSSVLQSMCRTILNSLRQNEDFHFESWTRDNLAFHSQRSHTRHTTAAQSPDCVQCPVLPTLGRKQSWKEKLQQSVLNRLMERINSLRNFYLRAACEDWKGPRISGQTSCCSEPTRTVALKWMVNLHLLYNAIC